MPSWHVAHRALFSPLFGAVVVQGGMAVIPRLSGTHFDEKSVDVRQAA